MIGGRGVVLTSEEAIHENKDTFTHWTPIHSRDFKQASRTPQNGHTTRFV